jgi:hypothetical protein
MAPIPGKTVWKKIELFGGPFDGGVVNYDASQGLIGGLHVRSSCGGVHVYQREEIHEGPKVREILRYINKTLPRERRGEW